MCIYIFIKIVMNNIIIYSPSYHIHIHIRIYSNISLPNQLIIIYYVIFLYKYLAVEDDEVNVAYLHSIVEDLTAHRLLPVVGPARNVILLNALAVLVFLSSVPYCSLFLQVTNDFVEDFIVCTQLDIRVLTKCLQIAAMKVFQ